MLKNAYTNNYNKLLKYAKSCNFKVIYASCNASAEWNPKTKTITLSHDYFNNKAEIAFFLHELGHALDDAQQTDKGYVKYLDLCYRRFNKLINTNKKIYITENQKYSVIFTEYRAWKNARDIAKLLRIKLGDWFYKEEFEGLKTYFEIAFPKSFEEKFKQFVKDNNL